MKKFAIIDHRASDKIKASLKGLNFELIEMPSFSKLQAPVSAHPDMLMTVVGSNIFCSAEYRSAAQLQFEAIDTLGYTVHAEDIKISSVYPEDIAYNCAVVGDKIYGLKKYMSPALLDHLNNMGAEVISIRQGYAKCSTAVLGDRGIISSDPSVLAAAKKVGTEALKISEGHISLLGYSHGFIGGACGCYGDKIYFAGDYMLHPDGWMIDEFCHRLGFCPISLSDEELSDIGTIFLI